MASSKTSTTPTIFLNDHDSEVLLKRFLNEECNISDQKHVVVIDEVDLAIRTTADSLCSLSKVFHILLFPKRRILSTSERTQQEGPSSTEPETRWRHPGVKDFQPDSFDEYILKVTHQPTVPFYKTASEAATLDYLRRYSESTSAEFEFPEVLFYSCNSENILKSEWILMRIRKPTRMVLPYYLCLLSDVWNKIKYQLDDHSTGYTVAFEKEKAEVLSIGAGDLDDHIKGSLAIKLAAFLREFRASCRFPAIGSLYKRKDLDKADLQTAVSVPVTFTVKESNSQATGDGTGDPPQARTTESCISESEFVIGRMVLPYRCWNLKEAWVGQNRGPFPTDRLYMEALCEAELRYIQVEIERLQGQLKDGGTPDTDASAEETLRKKGAAVKSLQSIINLIFPEPEAESTTASASHTVEPEIFTLSHHGLVADDVVIDRCDEDERGLPMSDTVMTSIWAWRSLEITPSWMSAGGTRLGLLSGPDEFWALIGLPEEPERFLSMRNPSPNWSYHDWTFRSFRLKEIFRKELMGKTVPTISGKIQLKQNFEKLLQGIILRNSTTSVEKFCEIVHENLGPYY